MDGQETVIGDVIGQFYSFFGSLRQLRDTITTSPGLSQPFRDGVLEQLADLESEWAGHRYTQPLYFHGGKTNPRHFRTKESVLISALS